MTSLGFGIEGGKSPALPSEMGESVKACEPKIYQDSAIRQRLTQFCEQQCTISILEMNHNIYWGEELEKSLADPNITVDMLKKNGQATPENAVALMWLLTAKIASYDQLFVSGSMRLSEGRKVRDFLKACGNGQVYGRISTHFKENLGQLQADDPQWGFDLRNRGLPAKKNTILFALQPDGTLFIKMEEHGCPPFWKKGFFTFANFTEFVSHALDFISTRFSKKTTTRLLANRKEHVPKRIKAEFQDVMKLLFPPEDQSWFRRLLSKKEMSTEGEKLYKEGAQCGISKMESIVKTKQQELAIANVNSGEAASAVTQKIAQFQGQLTQFNLRPLNYSGDIKGYEVLLPPLEIRK